MPRTVGIRVTRTDGYDDDNGFDVIPCSEFVKSTQDVYENAYVGILYKSIVQRRCTEYRICLCSLVGQRIKYK